jgi:hypothetical protein
VRDLLAIDHQQIADAIGHRAKRDQQRDWQRETQRQFFSECPLTGHGESPDQFADDDDEAERDA